MSILNRWSSRLQKRRGARLLFRCERAAPDHQNRAEQFVPSAICASVTDSTVPKSRSRCCSRSLRFAAVGEGLLVHYRLSAGVSFTSRWASHSRSPYVPLRPFIESIPLLKRTDTGRSDVGLAEPSGFRQNLTISESRGFSRTPDVSTNVHAFSFSADLCW
jgi:hypothetical protein